MVPVTRGQGQDSAEEGPGWGMPWTPRKGRKQRESSGESRVKGLRVQGGAALPIAAEDKAGQVWVALGCQLGPALSPRSFPGGFQQLWSLQGWTQSGTGQGRQGGHRPPWMAH